MASRILVASCLLALAGAGLADNGRKILQNRNPATGTTVTVSAASPTVNAIAITPALPYPQNGIFCNVTGDSRIPAAGAFFPLTVRVPVGVQATVVFANITGTIPGTGSGGGAGGCSSVVQQPGTSVVQQPGTSVVQQPGTSVVQQPGSSVVQQPGTTVSCTTSVVQQPTTIVQQQQKSPSPPTTVVQQPTSPTPPTTVVQQPTPPSPPKSPSPPTTVVQQPTPPTPPTTVVQQPTPPSPPRSPSPPTTVVQQPGTSVVQQPGSTVVQQGRRLLQTAAPIEFISNNGSMGQPQLTVLATTEGVPNIMFKPTAAGQTASFQGGLQVAITTTNNGLGTPFIPYVVDSRLSPQCGVTVNFVTA